MITLTKKEQAWVDELQAVINRCPSPKKIGFYTIGDPNTNSGALSYVGNGFGQWQSGAGVNINFRNLVLNAANQVPTASENRVKNIAFNFIVRAA